MSEIKNYTPGTFCWTDLAVKDLAKEKKYYANVFGWGSQDLPAPDTDEAPYSLLQVDHKSTCALYPEHDHHKQAPQWLTYISVENVDETIKKANEAGGTLITPAMDVMDAGRLAVLQDPTGARFAVWQAKEFVGAEIQETAGSVCWRELITSNVDVAGKFYASIFGWEPKVSDKGDRKYLLFSKGKELVCGMMAPPERGIPTHWITYWETNNCDQTVEKAKRFGGHVIKGTTEIKDVGRFAILLDPEGAEFGVHEFKH